MPESLPVFRRETKQEPELSIVKPACETLKLCKVNREKGPVRPLNRGAAHNVSCFCTVAMRCPNGSHSCN